MLKKPKLKQRNFSFNPLEMKRALNEMSDRLEESMGKCMDALNSSIEACENYKKDPTYLERLYQKQDQLRRQLEDLRAKIDLLY